jgi:hypothetical protein
MALEVSECCANRNPPKTTPICGGLTVNERM